MSQTTNPADATSPATPTATTTAATAVTATGAEQGPGKPKPGTPAQQKELDHAWFLTTSREKYKREDGSYDYQKLNADLLQTSIDTGLPVTRGDGQKLKGYLKKQLGADFKETEADELLAAADKTWADFEKRRFNAVRTSWRSPSDSSFTRSLGYSANKPLLDTRPQDERLGRWGLQMHSGVDAGEDAADVLRKYRDQQEGAEDGQSLYRRSEAETQLMFNNYQRDRQVLVGQVDEQTGTRGVQRDEKTGQPVKRLGGLDPEAFHTWDFDADGEPRLVEWNKDTDPNKIPGELVNISQLLPKAEESTVASAVLGIVTMGAAGNGKAAGEQVWDAIAGYTGYDASRVSLRSRSSGLGQSVAEFGPQIESGLYKLHALTAGLAANIDEGLGRTEAAAEGRANQRKAYHDAAQIAPNLNIDARGGMFSNLPSFAHNLSQQGGQQLVQQTLNVASAGTLGFAYMAATSAEQGYSEGRKAGLTEGEATSLGAALGVLTYGTEKLLDPGLWKGTARLLKGGARAELGNVVVAEQKGLIAAVAKELRDQGIQDATSAQVEAATRKYAAGFLGNVKRGFDGVGKKLGGVKQKMEQTALGGMGLEATQEFFQEGGDQLAQTGAYALARTQWLEDENGTPRPAWVKQSLKDGSNPLAEKSWSDIYDQTIESMLGGAVAGGVFAAPFAWANAKSAREAKQNVIEANQTEQFAQYLVDRKFDTKSAEKIKSEVTKWQSRGQLGTRLTPDGNPTDNEQETENFIVGKSLLNKIDALQALGKGTNLDQLVNGRNNPQLTQLLSASAGQEHGYQRVQQGLKTLYQVHAQKQEIDRLLNDRPALQRDAATGEAVVLTGEPSVSGVTGVTGVTKPGFDPAQGALGMSAEAYGQEVAARRAALQAEGEANGDDAARTDQEKKLEKQVQRAKDPGALGVITRNADANAYYESRLQETEMQQQLEQATTTQDEQQLSQQLSQVQEQSAELLRKAQASSADNAPLQKVLQITEAQLGLEDLQRQQQKLFSGEAVAEHVVEGFTNLYAQDLEQAAEEDPTLVPVYNALADALEGELGTGSDAPTARLRTLTRWQQQHLTSQPEAQQQAAEQQFAQAQQATASLVALAEQLPAATLQDEAGLSALVAQTEQIVQNAPALAGDNPDLIQALSQDVATQAKRLTEEGRAALPEAQVLEAAYAQLPGVQEQLQQVTEALTSAQPEEADALVDEQLSLEQQLDDAKADVRSKFQPVLATQLEKAAAKLAALPVQAAAQAALTPVAQLEAQFYTGLHDVMPQPGALKSAVADWLQASGEELSARSEPALARLEQQAALNRLHLELRAQDAPALHAPGALPKGVAGKYLAPMEADTYQAADTALRAVEQDLRTVRDKFAQSANSRFGRDNELQQLASAARHGQLTTLAEAITGAEPGQQPELDAIVPEVQQLRKALASSTSVLLGGDATAANQAVVQAEENLRTSLAAKPAAAVTLHQQLLATLPVTDTRFTSRPDRQQVARYMAGTNYNGTPTDGIFTYLNTLLGISPGRWAAAYAQVATGLVGSDAASPGKLPSLEQQQVVQAINGFLTSTTDVLGSDNAIAAQELRQQQNPKEKVTVARHVLYVPGSAGTGKTKMVIRTAMLTQAALGNRSAANPYKIVATAPHARQQQTLAQQLTGESLQAQAHTLDNVIASLRSGSFDADVLVADEVTIYSDEQTQALLKALAAYNLGRAVPVRLVALGDPAQMAGRDAQGKRSRSQYFTDPLNRLCLSTRPLTQVYRTGIVTAYQLFDKQRTRILSADPAQNADLSPVPGMRFSVAGNDATTLRGVTYQRADEQRQQAADLIKALQATPGETRTVRLVVSAQLVAAETDALRALGVVDAGQYVLDADALPSQGGVVNDVDQAQGGEFDFVFTAVAEQYPLDQVGTMADDAVNTLRAQFVGASRMKQYASVRYDAATYGQYQNEQVDQLEEFAPESAKATTTRNEQKLQLLATVAAQPAAVPAAPTAAVPAAPAAPEAATPPAAIPVPAPAPMTAEAQERVSALNEVAAGLNLADLNHALKVGVELSPSMVQIYREQSNLNITNLQGYIANELAKPGGDHTVVQALAKQVQQHATTHGTALAALGAGLREQQLNLLTLPGDVALMAAKAGEFSVIDTPERRAKLSEAAEGGLLLVDDGKTVRLLAAEPNGPVQELDRFELVALEKMTGNDVTYQQNMAQRIREQAQKLREQRQRQVGPIVTPANSVPAGDGQLLLPVLAKGQTVNDLALEGRAILSHYAVRESDALADPRYLQANQAFQARLVSRLAAVKNGSLSAAELQGLPAPQGGEFNGQGAFRLVWQREYQAYGQVDRSPGLTRNFFTIEYVEGVNADGMALRRMEVGQVYKDAPSGSTGPITGRIHRGKTASPFDAQLDQLMKDQTQAGAKTVSLPLGSSLPMERVKHPYYNALTKSNATPGGVEAKAEASSTYNTETLSYEKLGAELAQRGIAVSSPWVITVKQDEAETEPGQSTKKNDVYLGHSSWSAAGLSGSPVLFYQRSGTQQAPAEQVDKWVDDALQWMADEPTERTPTDVVTRLFDTHGLEMVLAKTSAFEVELFHYQAALHPDQAVPATATELSGLLRTQLTEQGEVVRLEGEDVNFTPEQRAVKQMLFSSDQFEALKQRGQEQSTRRGLRNKIIRAVQMAGVATKQGDKWVSGVAMNTLTPRQKRHLKAILTALEARQFGTDKSDEWQHLSAAWAEDLFTYLNYLDARTGGEVSQAWSQDSERNNNPVQLRLYGGSGDDHKVPFAKVKAPAGIPVGKLMGASRLTMTGMGSVVNLHRALQQGQLEENKAATTKFAAPAQTSGVPVVAQSSAAVPEAVPVEANELKDTNVLQSAAPAAVAISAPAAPSDSNMSRRRNSLNQSKLMQGDAYPAEAEARLRQLFGTELEFELNKGISFMRELGQMAGNLITLATDNGLTTGLVNLATANHEAIHRVLRIVSPAYKKKVLDAHREVLAREENSRHTAEQLADDDYVEEKLARYYERADLRTHQQAGDKFRSNPVVKFLDGFAAGRLVLRALQAISKAANRLAKNPDYLAELFADMEKGYYRERSVRQRYLEEKANSLNTGDSPKGRRLRDLDSLESVLGGLDIVYDWVDRIKQDTYGDMFEFNPARPRRTFAESRAAVTASAQQFAQDIAQEYAGQIPGVHDLDALRAEDGQWHALQTVVERAGSPDEDGNPTFVQKTAFDIILDYAFAHLGESAGQGVDREGEAVRETQGADGEENEARVNAAITASQDGTNIPAWEKDREAREGASLQMHLDATPLYQVVGWEASESDYHGHNKANPLIARDSKKRYVDPRIVQSILDDVFAAAWSTSVYEGSEVLLVSELRARLKGRIASEFGDTQATALSLYLKLFNGLPSDPTQPQENNYLTVRNEQGQDVTPVSFFEVLYPEQAVNVQARNAQPAIRESYAREYQHALSELIMFYQSARRNTAADVNVVEGLVTTGGKSARGERANKEKAMGRENLAGRFLMQSADGTMKLNPAAMQHFRRAGFDFVAGQPQSAGLEHAKDANGIRQPLAATPTVVITHKGKPFLQWQVRQLSSTKRQLVGVRVSEMPVTEQAGAFAALLQAAGLDVEQFTLAEAMADARHSTRRHSVLGYNGINETLTSLATSVWSQAVAMQLQEQSQEQASVHPAFGVVLDASQTDIKTDDVSRYNPKPNGEAQMLRSPTTAWASVRGLQGTLMQWAKGGQQSSVRTADGSTKHLRRFTPSMMHRWRQLQVKAKNFRERPRILAEMAKGEWERKNYAAQLPPAETDIGLHWSGVAQGQPVSWTNKFLSGALKIADVLELNVLENPLMGKRQSIVKASRGELHDVAAWYLFWGAMIASKGEQVALPNPPKADKTSQNARVLERDNRDKRGADGQLERLAYQYNDASSDTALRELHNSYLAQFYGAVVPRWEQHGGFVKPAGFDSLPAAEAVAVLETHRNAMDGKALKKSALRSGVDYGKTGISPALKAVLAQTPEAFAAQIKQSIQAEARQLIEQGMSGVPEQVWKPIRSNTIVGVPSLYDQAKKFKAQGKDNREPLQAADGTLHPLLLDYLLTHRILAQHLDTALTGHHIYYPKGPVDMAKRGVLDHTAYETPDLTNPRGLPRFQRVLVMDDLSMQGTHNASGHAGQLRGVLRGLGWSEKQIADKLADTVNQDGLGFMDPLHWRLERESQGMKYPLREQIKNIQGGMLSDGTPFVFKNCYLILSNQLLAAGNEQVWNMVAQSLGGYESPLYQRWLEIRAGLRPEQLAVEADWDQLHEEYVASRQGDNFLADAHIGRIVLASGNKVAPHSVQDMGDPQAHAGAFKVDNLLGGRVLSLYQNPDLVQATIANITQENHNLVVGGRNYEAMQTIYARLAELADADLQNLMEQVQASAEKDGKDGRQYFYERAVESLTALGNITNSLSLIRYQADENVPLIARQITGAIASSINKAIKQRMSGLRATVATMTGLVPMYNVEWTDQNNVPRFERYTQQQVLKRGLATLTDGKAGPAQLVWADGVQARRTELNFTQLSKAGQPASADEAAAFVALARDASSGNEVAAAELEALISQNEYAVAGQEVLVPRETAAKFGIKPGDDVADVNEAGPAYFMEQHGGDEAKAQQAWANWQQFLQPKSTRVPHTGMNSTQMSQVVGFIDGHGNTVIVPSEGEIIAGFDNDGDQTTLEFAEVRRGGLTVQPGSPAGLRQQLFEAKAAVFGNVRNLDQLLKPLTSDDIMDLAKQADEQEREAQKERYGATDGFHSHGRNINLWTNAQDGKSGVGPAVKVRETFNNLYMLARQNPAFNQFVVPSFFDGETFATVTERVARVVDYFEQLANGALDNAKNNTLGPLNINQYTLGAYGAAGVMGWSLEQATRVLNHPVARAIVQQVQTGNSIYNSKKEDVRLLDVLRENVLGANPGIVQLYNYNEQTGDSWLKNKTQLTRELVDALTEKHGAQNTAGLLTDGAAIEHMLLLSVKGDDLLKIQGVLSPMSGVDSNDFDSENKLTKLAETLGVVGNTELEVETNLERLINAPLQGGDNSGNTMVDPLAVLLANPFAVSGVRAMLQDARERRKGQIVRQPQTRATFFGTIRQLAPEAKSFKVHNNLVRALDQVLDADFVSRLGALPVPVQLLDNETDAQLKTLLGVLAAADLKSSGGRHQFVGAMSNLLYVLKTRGKSEPDLLGGLGQSALIQELEFDQFENNFGLVAKLARATEMNPEVKNFLEREFGKLSQLSPEAGGYLQQALVVYQLLGQGLVMGRGSLAEIFSPAALGAYSDNRGQVKRVSLKGHAVVAANRIEEVLTRESNLVPQVFLKRDRRSDEELGMDLEMASQMEPEEADNYLDEQDRLNQVEDNSLYFAASQQLPAVLTGQQVQQGLDRNGRRLAEKGKLSVVRLRNKEARGNVLYKIGGEQGQWVRQFPVGNPNLNLYGTPLLSPYPVYVASSPLESLNVQTNENLREHLRQVRAYIKTHDLQGFVKANGGLRVMDRYGRPIEADVRKLCE